MKENCFQGPDGTSLTWYEAGQGQPLVLLHGWAMSAAAFTEITDRLANGFRVLVPDLPGHGQSSPPGRKDLAGLAAILTHWLSATLKAQPFTLAGWSLGGMLSLQMAHARELPVAKLVLIASTPKFTMDGAWNDGLPKAQVRAMIRNLNRRFEATLAEFFTLTFAGETLRADRLREIRNFAVRASVMPDRQTASALLNVLLEQDQRDMLADIRIPALILHGEIDRISPIAAGRYLADRLPSGEFVVLEGVGHAPFLSQPQVVAARLLELS